MLLADNPASRSAIRWKMKNIIVNKSDLSDKLSLDAVKLAIDNSPKIFTDVKAGDKSYVVVRQANKFSIRYSVYNQPSLL